MTCSRWIAGAHFWLAMTAGAAAAVGDAKPLALTPGGVHENTLAAGAHRRHSIVVPAGRAVEVSVQQFDAVLRLQATSDAGASLPPVQNDAGRQAKSRLTLTADRRTVWQIDVAARDPKQPAHYRIAAGRLHPAGDTDHAHATGEQVLAEAENLRRGAGSLELGNTATAATPEQIRAKYQQAVDTAQRSGDECLQLMANAGRARYEFATGQYATARDFAAAALGFHCGAATDAAAAAEEAVAQRTLGAALGYLGDFARATAASESALALYRKTGDPNFQAMLLANLSANYRTMGATQKALDAAGAALALAEKTGDRKRAVFCRESIAAIHLQRGEWGRALEAYRQTLDALRETPYPMIEGMSRNDMGLLYRQLGEVDESQRAFQQAEAVWTASKDQSGLAETLLNEGDLALEAGNIEAARTAFQRSLDFDQANGFQREQAHALIGRGRVAAAKGDTDAARADLVAARDLAHKIDVLILEAAALQALGDLESREGHDAAALADYEQAYALALKANDFGTQVTTLGSRARLELNSRRAAQARPLIEQAIALIESERAQIASPALRTDYFATQRAYYDLYIDVLMRLDDSQPGRGLATAALEASERARARALRDALAERDIVVAPHAPGELIAAERQAEDELREAAWQSRQPSGRDAAAAAAQQRVDAASRRLDDARARLRAADPRFAELAHPTPPSIAALQPLIDDGTAVFEYWLGDSASYLWRVTKSGVRHFALPARAKLDEVADALRESIVASGTVDASVSFEARAEAAVHAAWRQPAAALAGTLLPSGATDGVRTMIVIADGELQRIPFTVFDAAPGRTFAYLPSLATLPPLRASPRGETATPAIAIFADPVLRADDPRLGEVPARAAPTAARPLLAAAGETGIGALARLPYSADEAASIAALVPAAQRFVATGFDASRAAALNAPWGRYTLAHFATHAMINLRHPELSGVVLSLYSADGREQDGFLRMTDVYNLRMPVDLVVLGVCDASRETGRGAEGMFGLSRAFFHAGVRRLVLSLWPVDDRASAALLSRFYRHLLAERVSPQQALADAQAELRADPRWSAPYYWAGFVVQGDWQ